MDQVAKKIFTKEEGTQRLMEMSLTPEMLAQTAQAIAMNKGNADEYCPPQAGGMMGWVGGVRTFRLGLANVGFKLRNSKGFSSVISPDGKYEFFIMSGTAGVGMINKNPRSKAQRGIQTVRRVEENQLSFPLDQLLVQSAEATHDLSSREHWCFIYKITKRAIFSEFSKPSAVDENNFVTEWSERILLDPVMIASETVVVGDGDTAPAADVKVTLKSEYTNGISAEQNEAGKRAKGSD